MLSIDSSSSSNSTPSLPSSDSDQLATSHSVSLPLPLPLPHDIFTITDQLLATQYTFESEIGYGNWGSIWRISPNNPSSRLHPNSKLAIKLVHRLQSSSTTSTKIKSLWSEFKILRQFKSNPHPNILRVSSFIITPSYALLTMAYHPTILPVSLGHRSPKLRRYLRGLLSATEFLHLHRVSHNDLKPANVVLSLDDQPVLIDFGFAVAYPPDHTQTTGKAAFWSNLSWGTPEYLSPQRAQGEEHDERLSDIWSLGVTFYEIVVGRTPFEMNESEEFLSKEALQVYYQRTLKAEFLGPHTLSPLLRQLLVSMLRPDPHERLSSCTAGLQHPFFMPSSPNVRLRSKTLASPPSPHHLRSPSDPEGRALSTHHHRPPPPSTSKNVSKLTIIHAPNRSISKRLTPPTKPKPKAAVLQDPHATPKSGPVGSQGYRTPTRSILATKSLNAPIEADTPRQNKSFTPPPRFHLKNQIKPKTTKTSVSPRSPSHLNRIPALPSSSTPARVDPSKKRITKTMATHPIRPSAMVSGKPSPIMPRSRIIQPTRAQEN